MQSSSDAAAQPSSHAANEDQLCHTCRWGWRFEEQDVDPPFALGECHRHAPQSTPNGSVNWRTTWPIVHGSQGCGEWTSR